MEPRKTITAFREDDLSAYLQSFRSSIGGEFCFTGFATSQYTTGAHNPLRIRATISQDFLLGSHSKPHCSPAQLPITSVPMRLTFLCRTIGVPLESVVQSRAEIRIHGPYAEAGRSH